jgi:hypothetical protein
MMQFNLPAGHDDRQYHPGMIETVCCAAQHSQTPGLRAPGELSVGVDLN